MFPVLFYYCSFADRSSTEAALAHYYGGACLSVDAVVTDVLINGTSHVSLTARKLYDCAAAQYAEKKAGKKCLDTVLILRLKCLMLC